MPTSVPSSAEGTTSVGMSVARKLCRNTSITRNTSATASASGTITSRIATLMKVVEPLGRAETPLGRDGGGHGLIADRRLRADGAGGELRVLRLHGGEHPRGRQAVGSKAIGIEPDAHRVLGAELHRGAHSGDALHLIENARGHEVVELLGARAARRRAQTDRAEKSGADFRDADALLIDFGGQARLRERHP